MAQSQPHAHHRVSNPRREHRRRSRHPKRSPHKPRRLPAHQSPTYDGGKDSRASWRIARKKPGVVYHLYRYFEKVLPPCTWAVQCTTKASQNSFGPAPRTTHSQPKVDDHHARTNALDWLKRQATHAHVFVGPRHCRSRWSRQVDDRAIVHHCDGANETRRSLRTTSSWWNHSFPEPFPLDEPKPTTNWPCTSNNINFRTNCCSRRGSIVFDRPRCCRFTPTRSLDRYPIVVYTPEDGGVGWGGLWENRNLPSCCNAPLRRPAVAVLSSAVVVETTWTSSTKCNITGAAARRSPSRRARKQTARVCWWHSCARRTWNPCCAGWRGRIRWREQFVRESAAERRCFVGGVSPCHFSSLCGGKEIFPVGLVRVRCKRGAAWLFGEAGRCVHRWELRLWTCSQTERASGQKPELGLADVGSVAGRARFPSLRVVSRPVRFFVYKNTPLLCPHASCPSTRRRRESHCSLGRGEGVSESSERRSPTASGRGHEAAVGPRQDCLVGTQARQGDFWHQLHPQRSRMGVSWTSRCRSTGQLLLGWRRPDRSQTVLVPTFDFSGVSRCILPRREDLRWRRARTLHQEVLVAFVSAETTKFFEEDAKGFVQRHSLVRGAAVPGRSPGEETPFCLLLSPQPVATRPSPSRRRRPTRASSSVLALRTRSLWRRCRLVPWSTEITRDCRPVPRDSNWLDNPDCSSQEQLNHQRLNAGLWQGEGREWLGQLQSCQETDPERNDLPHHSSQQTSFSSSCGGVGADVLSFGG